MALRGGRRAIFRSPAKLRAARRRGREMIGAPGRSSLDQRRCMVAAPISSVSSVPAPVQQPVGEDMAAIEIGGELDFVDRRRKSTIEVARHGLDGRDPIARRCGA